MDKIAYSTELTNAERFRKWMAKPKRSLFKDEINILDELPSLAKPRTNRRKTLFLGDAIASIVPKEALNG